MKTPTVQYLPSSWLRRSLGLLIACVLVLTASAQNAFWQEMHKGEYNYKRGKNDRALFHYMRALRLDSTNMMAYYNMGDAALACDSADLALKAFSKVASRSRDAHLRTLAFHNKGVIYQAMAMASKEQGQRNQLLYQAIDEYKRSLRLNPKSDPTRYNLALCLKLLRDSGENPKQPQQQPQQQEDKKEQEQEKQQKEQEKQQPPQPQQQPPKQPPRSQNQMMEYARRKEQETKKKMQGVQQALPSRRKNW